MKLSPRFICLIACYFSTTAAWSNEDTQSSLTLNVSAVAAKPPSVKTEGEIKFEGTKYQSSIPENSKLDQSLSASAHLKIGMDTELTQSVFDISGEKYIDWGSSEFSVRELYTSTTFNEAKSQASLGRKVEFWSQADSDWHLDLWQPNQIFDGLRPEQQGLTGAFYRHQEGSIETLAFASPIFIPTLGPDIKNDNGSLSADSRWYRSPSSTFKLFDQERKIVYSLNVPNLEELISKPGAGLRLVIGGRTSGGPWAATGYAYKPMNKLLVKYDKKLTSSEEGEDTGNAPLFPVVGYHSLFSADLGYKFASSQVVLSYLTDQPQEVDQASDAPYIIQRPAPAKVYSAMAETELELGFLNNPLGVSVGYLRIDGGDIADYDAQNRHQGAVFKQRFIFTHAAQIQAEIRTDIKDRKLISRFRYLREFEQRGIITSGELTYFPVHTIGVTLGADVLGVDKGDSSNTSEGFLNEFRANDRVYAGLSYVF
jgi:hypothetical protein